jgi:outer membrane lipoprotein carrier protein
MIHRTKSVARVIAVSVFAFCFSNVSADTKNDAIPTEARKGIPLAQAESTGTVAETQSVASLKAKLDAMQSLSGRFKQVLNDKTGALLQASEGSFDLMRPDYFLWRSEAPYEQTVLGTPDKVWVYDPDLEQVTIQKRTPEQENNPASLLAGDVDHIRETFYVTESVEKGLAVYDLKPLNEQSGYRTLRFVFAGATLQRITFVDKLDQATTIEFLKLKVNPTFANDFFTFTPPEGTDVIVDE